MTASGASMPRLLKAYIAGVVAVGAIALVAATLVIPVNPQIAISFGDAGASINPTEGEILAGIGFWILINLVAAALPVTLSHGTQMDVGHAPTLAAIFLGGPAVGGWVAVIGTTEIRELRGEVPWYGVLANRAGIVIPAIVAGLVYQKLPIGDSGLLAYLMRATLAGAVFYGLNVVLVGILVSLRSGNPVRATLIADLSGTATPSLALVPLGWLMAVVYSIEWWITLLFVLPLYSARMASQRLVEMREMFTQTIGALAEAVDKRDPFTAKHSLRVREISVDIGRVMRVSASELEALEWGGLLHDVGKIGVPDNVLLKQDRLTKEERMIMNAHPVLGAQIISPVTRLAPELPIIRHHHEWYNGSGYPDRLIGDEIPKLARILHVADAFEAMTAARPYRMTPLTNEQALSELRKFAGIQFDPVMVDAFVKTHHVDGVADPGRTPDLRPIPLLAHSASRMTSGGPSDPAATQVAPSPDAAGSGPRSPAAPAELA
jgi:putative nucleotidyltransferase with HDIG domain